MQIDPSNDMLAEARRQVEICNACRYCEGFCSVFPALHRNRAFADGDLTQMANLCHNCRGCYYACQYTAPHEFDLNLPQALANVRRDSWQRFAWPGPFARLYQTHGVGLAVIAILSFAIIFALGTSLANSAGEGFYAVLSHGVMVAIFAPAFLFPVLSLAYSLRAYWRSVDGQPLRWAHVVGALRSVSTMKDLGAGHGEGCNFEDQDRFSQARRYAHQAVMYGFLLCFAATSAGTVLHYGFGIHAPYPLWSLPKFFGISGGVLLTLGTIVMARLKLKADQTLGDQPAFGGEMAFIGVLGFVAFSGLALYALGSTAIMPTLLALHLGAVLSLFLLTPYSKMAHGFYRLAALIREEQNRQRPIDIAAE